MSKPQHHIVSFVTTWTHQLKASTLTLTQLPKMRNWDKVASITPVVVRSTSNWHQIWLLAVMCFFQQHCMNIIVNRDDRYEQKNLRRKDQWCDLFIIRCNHWPSEIFLHVWKAIICMSIYFQIIVYRYFCKRKSYFYRFAVCQRWYYKIGDWKVLVWRYYDARCKLAAM